MNAGQGALQDLVQDLGFSLNSTSFYSTDEQVARSGDDSVRLSDRGTAQYLYEGKDGGGLFPVPSLGRSGPLFDSVETCRQAALSAMSARCGEARLYLMSVRARAEGWEIDFGYSLNGVPVLLERGSAARFLVHYVVGATIWAEYMPEVFFGLTMTTPWFYSLLYNGFYMAIDMALCLVIFGALSRPLGKYFMGADIRK